MKYIVYLTTNIKNNKIYVGVHKTENPDKFDGYLGCGVNRNKPSTILNPKTPFQHAVKKYGFDYFKRVTIKVFDTLEEALDLEIEIVNDDFISRQDTYNITLGGGLPPMLNKIIYQYTLNGEYLREYSSIHCAAINLNGSESAISQAILFNRSGLGYLWADYKVENLDMTKYFVYSPKVKVYQYDCNGEFDKMYESLSECVKSLDSNLHHVQRAIKTGCMCKGVYLSNNLTQTYIKPKLERLSGLVHQYDLNGKYIRSYNSIKEAEFILGIKLSGINNSIKLEEQYKGFLWRRGDKVDAVQPYKNPKCSAKKVGQYTMDGNLVKIFNTVREARKEFPNVSKVLNGTASHCHNYNFKYID